MKLETVPPLIPKTPGSTSLCLNPDFAFLLWKQEGSCRGAAEYLAASQITSYQGKPYTRAAVHLAAKHSPLYVQAQKKLAAERKISIRRMQRELAKQ